VYYFITRTSGARGRMPSSQFSPTFKISALKDEISHFVTDEVVMNQSYSLHVQNKRVCTILFIFLLKN
jgi:hypothetical protein